jgi:hypothetical protein
MRTALPNPGILHRVCQHSVFVRQRAVMKFLGPKANKSLANGEFNGFGDPLQRSKRRRGLSEFDL